MIIWVLPLQVEWFAEHMRAEDHSVSVIHGDQPPEERKRIMMVGCSLIFQTAVMLFEMYWQ